MRETENHFEETTDWRMKMVEKAGVKVSSMLTDSDPWSGLDCARESCWLCETKLATGKLTSQECTRRNLVYETFCMTCEEMDGKKVEDGGKEEGDKRAGEDKRETKLYKYVGETCRSVWERSAEHQADLRNLNPTSHLLKHVLDKHEKEDMESVRFGIRVIKYMRTAFDRQILESVIIQQERLSHHLLNSRAEYNRCAIPRLSSKIGEKEYKKWEEEGEREQEKEDILKEKIVQMKGERDRKQREARKLENKERQPNPTDQRASKRQKLDEGNYKEKRKYKKKIQPTIGRGGKRKEDDRKAEHENTKQKEEVGEKEKMKTFQQAGKRKKEMTEMEKWIEERDNVEESRWTDFPNYEERAREINRNLLKETRDRESRIERARKEEKTWELIRLCTSFFDDHCDTWQKNTKERRSLREKEEKREERKRKANLEKLTFKVGYAQKRINTFLRKLPENERRNFESEEEKKRRKRLKEIKETMWKRSRMEGEQLQTKYETNLQSLEDRLETLETLYKKCEEEEKKRMEKMEEEKRERKEKRQKKSERLLQKSKLEEKWAMMRWLIKYIEENQEQWRVDREIRQNEMTGEIIEEKITATPDGENNEISEERKWEIWREKARERNIRRKQEPVRVALLNLDR